jgi:hypothetical protein
MADQHILLRSGRFLAAEAWFLIETRESCQEEHPEMHDERAVELVSEAVAQLLDWIADMVNQPRMNGAHEVPLPFPGSGGIHRGR